MKGGTLALNLAIATSAIAVTPGGVDSVILKEDGDAILSESGDFLLIE